MISKTVYILGVVSFFTDISSEMIYPLLPVFLTQTLGAGPVALGIIEGFADAISSFLKLIAGVWTDKVGKRKPFIVAGYLIATISRPLIAFAKTWHFVFTLRFLDRVGKGVRTSPRDALIADVTSPEIRGSAYGIHRSMDHAGAIVGPLVASLLLGYFGLTLNKIFLLAAIPAFLGVVLLIVGIKEPKRRLEVEQKIFNPIEDWKVLNPQFKIYLLSMFIFTLGNSTDAFLLLKLSQGGVPTKWIPVLWSGLHIIKMASTYMGGKFSDSFGKKRMIILGWSYYSLVYFGFAFITSLTPLIMIFLSYGLFYGISEPAERALVAEIVPANLRGTAFGFFHSVVGVSSLPASILFGVIWQIFGASWAFITGALFSFLAIITIIKLHKN
jgi:MFS family permease